MTNPNTGELIVTTPSTIVVPWALKHTAKHVLNATSIQQNTPLAATDDTPVTSTFSKSTVDDYDVITSQLIKQRTSSDSTWLIGDPQRAFAYVENWPISVEPIPDGPMHSSRDIVSAWKCSERGTPGILERRHMIKNTA